MNTQLHQTTERSSYRTPELHELGNLDKIQRYAFGYRYDWLGWRCYKYCWF
jgi:hypothetical protein